MKKYLFLSTSMLFSAICILLMAVTLFINACEYNRRQEPIDTTMPQTRITATQCVENGVKVKVDFALDRGKQVTELGVNARLPQEDTGRFYPICTGEVEKGVYSVMLPYDELAKCKYIMTSYYKIENDNTVYYGTSDNVNLKKGTPPDIEILNQSLVDGHLLVQVATDSTIPSDIRNVKLKYSTEKYIFEKDVMFKAVEFGSSEMFNMGEFQYYGHNISEISMNMPTDAEYFWFKVEATNDVGKATSNIYTINNGLINLGNKRYVLKTYIVAWLPYSPVIFGGGGFVGILPFFLFKRRKKKDKPQTETAQD